MNYDNTKAAQDNQDLSAIEGADGAYETPAEDGAVTLTADEIKAQKKADAKVAYDLKAAEKKAAKEAKDAASAVAKQEAKERKAAERAQAAEVAAAAVVVKRVPKTAEEKRLAINAATALRRSTPEGKAYAAAASAKAYAKRTAATKAAKQEAADLAALEALAAEDGLNEVEGEVAQ